MEIVKKLKVASSEYVGGGTVTTEKVHPYDFFDFEVIPGGPITKADREHYAELLECSAEQFQLCQSSLLPKEIKRNKWGREYAEVRTPTVEEVQSVETVVKNIIITLWQNMPQIVAADKRGIQK